MRFFKSVNTAITSGVTVGASTLAMMAREVLAQADNGTALALGADSESSSGARLGLLLGCIGVATIAVCVYRYRPQQVVQEIEVEQQHRQGLGV
jgi:hypothetical protein